MFFCSVIFQMLSFLIFSFPPPEPPCAGPPKFSLLFFPLPPPFSLFFSLSESSRGILVVFLEPGNLNRAHLRVPAPQTPPKFHEKTPRQREKERKWEREREKKREILGPPFVAPIFSGFLGLGPLRSPNFSLFLFLGGGGGANQTPNKFPVGVRGVAASPPKPRTSLGFGVEGGGGEGFFLPQTQPLLPLKPVSAAACDPQQRQRVSTKSRPQDCCKSYPQHHRERTNIYASNGGQKDKSPKDDHPQRNFTTSAWDDVPSGHTEEKAVPRTHTHTPGHDTSQPSFLTHSNMCGTQNS